MSGRSAPKSSPFPVYISPRHWPCPERTMPQGEALALFLKYKDSGNETFIHAILTGNMRRIHALCTKPHYQYTTIDPQDLVQEASIGFLTGIRNYDPLKGASVAPYAHFWAEKAIREYIRVSGHTIKIPDNCQRAYKLMMKRFDAARDEYQTENIAPDALLHDKHPYEIAGAIAIYTRSYGEPTSEPYENVAPGQRRDLQHALTALAHLPEPQKSVVMAYFGFGDDLKKLAKRMKLSEAEIDRIVKGSIAKLKRGFPKGDAPRSEIHVNPRGRMFSKAEQMTLFKVKR